jgi:hypothetical protein
MGCPIACSVGFMSNDQFTWQLLSYCRNTPAFPDAPNRIKVIFVGVADQGLGTESNRIKPIKVILSESPIKGLAANPTESNQSK